MRDRVSTCWPQVVPARALRTLRRRVAREMWLVMWEPKVKRGSRVTPKRRGFLARGSGMLLRGSSTLRIAIFFFENEFFAVKHDRYYHASWVKISGR